MNRIIKITLALAVILLLTSLVFAEEADPTQDNISSTDSDTDTTTPGDNTTPIALAIIGSIVPTMGLWLNYKTNHNKREARENSDKKEQLKREDDRNKVLLDKVDFIACRIDKIDERFDSLEARVEKQSETDETNISIKKMKFQLDQTSNILLNNIPDRAVKEVVTYGIGKLHDIYSGILIQEFDVDIQTIELQLTVAIKQIYSFYPSKSKLSDDRNEVLRKVLISKVELLLKKYIVDLNSIIRLSNGVRRGSFIERSNDFAEDSIILSLDIYDKFITEDGIKNN